MNFPEPPRNSQIKTKSEANGITLFWKKPSAGPFRFIVIAFLIFWLCGWAFGFVAAIQQLLAGKDSDGFMAIWLAGWTLGGLLAATILYMLLRPQKPESVTLERNRFRYDTGSHSMNFADPFLMMRKKQHYNPFAMMFQRRKIYEFTFADCPEFVLEGLGDDQRLRFDDGADRVTIGECLKEPEREWLAQVLKAWKAR